MSEHVVKIGPEPNKPTNVLEFKNAIDKSTCQQLYTLVSKAVFTSSTTTGDNAFCTSKTIHLDQNIPIIKSMNVKFSQMLNIPLEKGEQIQGAYYDTGSYFKYHTDYFEENEEEKFCKKSGQRVWSIMAFLNDGIQGGERVFPHYEKTFSPTEGTILAWRNIDEQGNKITNSAHFDAEVKKGNHAVIFKWFREKKFELYF